MKVRVCEKSVGWDNTKGAWYHSHRGETFEVLAIYASRDRLYEVDVKQLVCQGEIDTTTAFVPGNFADLVS